MISSAELIIYANDDEDTFSISLTPVQLKAISKLLGLEVKNSEVMMFSDESVQRIMASTLDKLKLQK